MLKKEVITIFLLALALGQSLAIKDHHTKQFKVMEPFTNLAQTKLFSDALIQFVGGLMDRGPPQKKDYYRMKGLEANRGAVRQGLLKQKHEKKKVKREKKVKEQQKKPSSLKSALMKTIQVLTPKTIHRHNLRHTLPLVKAKMVREDRQIKRLQKKVKELDQEVGRKSGHKRGEKKVKKLRGLLGQAGDGRAAGEKKLERKDRKIKKKLKNMGANGKKPQEKKKKSTENGSKKMNKSNKKKSPATTPKTSKTQPRHTPKDKTEKKNIKTKNKAVIPNSEIIIMKRDGRSIVTPLENPKNMKRSLSSKKHPKSKFSLQRKKLLKMRLGILKKMHKSLLRKMRRSDLDQIAELRHIKEIKGFDQDMLKLDRELKERQFRQMKRMVRLAKHISETKKVHSRLMKSWLKNKKKLALMAKRRNELLAPFRKDPKRYRKLLRPVKLINKVTKIDLKNKSRKMKKESVGSHIYKLMKLKKIGNKEIPRLKDFESYVNDRIRGGSKRQQDKNKNKKKSK